MSDSVPVDSQAVASIAPVTSLIVEDFKYDDGEKLLLSWIPSIDDVPEVGRITGYEVYRITDGGEPEKIGDLVAGKNSYEDDGLSRESQYQYYVVALSDGGSAMSVMTAPSSPEREWINFGRTNLFLVALIIGGAIIFFIGSARRGKKLFVRKIAGLEAVDEAIGRATEMGRPILFIPGIRDMDDVQTLAALTILGRVAEQVANYDVQIRMPVSRSLVMTAARETIKAGFQTAGRPDAYNDDMVNYVTDEQFGYVAAVDGVMVREKPATVFLLGAFFAESLILAETGNSVGAIQIAGTARPAQLPFFVAACDFTLIGEELFAASAYLSGEPKALGSLKGQDVGKGIAMAAILIGVASATLAELTGWGAMTSLLEIMKGLFSSQ
ncbi:MAG: fibronectin type III domain-containing protein [Candidatus Zixiibacteriota bacterium]|nr:MAG: fibronectin type III domain-containing protein [candidate division Zixibacteria bacterium]